MCRSSLVTKATGRTNHLCDVHFVTLKKLQTSENGAKFKQHLQKQNKANQNALQNK